MHVLGHGTVLIGMGERTTPMAAEILSHALFDSGQADTVIAVELPKSHAMMHLDTVMTMIDRATFVLYPYIDRHMRSWTITRDDPDTGLKVTHNRSLWDALAQALGVDAVTVDLAGQLRADKRRGVTGQRLAGRNIALIFEKTSTRTRSAFEVAAHDEGGHVTYLGPGESQLGHKESVKDTARVLGRMFDGIEYRGFAQESIEILGEFAGVPVWNGLTDTWHPTQMLADILTMSDHSSKPLAEVSFCYLGDGRNNTANSLLVTGATLGMDARICAPAALQPSAEIRGIAAGLAGGSGARLLVTEDVNTGVAGVDFVYTDVWLSLGEPEDEWGARIDRLLPYQVNAAVLKATGNPAVKFMHCLPALHNRDTEIGQQIYAQRGLDALEVTDEVFESPASVVFDQAENRMHTIKALMISTLGEGS